MVKCSVVARHYVGMNASHTLEAGEEIERLWDLVSSDSSNFLSVLKERKFLFDEDQGQSSREGTHSPNGKELVMGRPTSGSLTSAQPTEYVPPFPPEALLKLSEVVVATSCSLNHFHWRKMKERVLVTGYRNVNRH